MNFADYFRASPPTMSPLGSMFSYTELQHVFSPAREAQQAALSQALTHALCDVKALRNVRVDDCLGVVRPASKAWKVWDNESHVDHNVLVFAPTRNKARKLGRLVLDQLCECSEWVSIRAKREPEADKYAQQFGEAALDCSTTAQCRVMRELGYFEIEGNGTPCDVCGLYQWDLVPESRVYEYHEGCYCKRCAPVPAGTQFLFDTPTKLS